MNTVYNMAHGQDVHFDIAGDAIFGSERGNTELPALHLN